jgi:hypothetical protein
MCSYGNYGVSTNRYAPENDINEILALALKGSPKIVKSDVNEASQTSLKAFYKLLGISKNPSGRRPGGRGC